LHLARFNDEDLCRSIDYDEELARVLNFSLVAKEAIPGVKVAAPSTCAWWFCAFVLSFLVNFHFILTTPHVNRLDK
jgi:hypothetical protein